MSESIPSQEAQDFLERSLLLVGWDRVRQRLSALVCAEPTRALCLNLRPDRDFDNAHRALDETGEMIALLRSGDGFPITAFEDMTNVLESAEERLLVQPQQCLAVIKSLQTVRAIQRFLSNRKNCEHLHYIAEALDPLPALLNELERCIDEEGEIRPTASPGLRQALRNATVAREQLREKISKILADDSEREITQDGYPTQREGRWVIPVKTGARSRIEGIVHDTSGSGATLFMEPSSIIPLNNQVKICEIRVEQEKQKVLAELARQIHAHRDTMTLNQEILLRFDLIHAKARLGIEMDATRCPLNRGSQVDLKQARNPELLLNRQEVVPNDIGWDPAVRVLVISGPNTGGKTVTLKTVGLMSAMIRAGLFLPVKEGSAIGFFPELYADIGDDQNIQLNLSTFSAHLVKIMTILNNAEHGSLILLDELGISTDPQEGAALAEAILTELKHRDMTVLVSTHYLSLKYLGQTRDGFLNACTEFDAAHLKPTFRLAFGVPGNSAALETAERLGMPASILKTARKIFSEKDSDANFLLNKLNEQLLELERDKEVLQEQKEALERLVREQEETTRQLNEERREFNRKKAKQLQSTIREGKQTVRQLIEEAKKKKDLPALRQTEKKLQTMNQVPLSATSDVLDGWTVPADRLKPGQTVMINTLGVRGVLLNDPLKAKKVRVKMGNREMEVARDRIRGHANAVATRKHAPAQKEPVTIHVESTSAVKMSINLHGMRYDEATRALDEFINQAVANRMERITIIHGHGTGTLKKMVRDYIGKYGLGQSYGPGLKEEGGDAVTVVHF